MQHKTLTKSVSNARWWRTRLMRRVGIGSILMILWLAPLVTVNAWIGSKLHTKPGQKAAILASAGGMQWATSTQTTPPSFSVTVPATQDAHVDPLFQAYYASHAGASTLGQPLTAAFPTAQGRVQFFMSGALLLPPARPAAAAGSKDFSAQLIQDGLRDPSTGIVDVPLLHALLTEGSTMAVAGDGSSLTYIDLRSGASPSAEITAPDRPSLYAANAPEVFVSVGTRDGQDVGYMVASPIWSYINRADISPQGWQTNVGKPLSAPISLTAPIQGATHNLVAQVFWRAVLLMDADDLGANGQPTIWRADDGFAYLRTLGPPAVTLSPSTQVWALGDAPVRTAPATGSDIIHIGQNFPFTLTGDSRWSDGTLWYRVHWQVPHSSGDGWTPASAITFSNPGSGAEAWGSFDVLSPSLAQYLASQGNNTAAVVYDVTRKQYYTYRPDAQLTMASSAKVPIMLTLLTMTESQGREPNGDEMNLLTAMIENSDNDAAQALFDEIGGTDPMNSFMHSVGIPGMSPDPDAWGWSTVSPLAMVRLLTLLHEGKVLNAQDRSLALNLMENVESDQQIGVGDTAPQGATVALKDGWVPGPDGLWAMNSSGIVTVGSETYIIAVYTQGENSLDDGWAITRHVCGAVAQLLA